MQAMNLSTGNGSVGVYRWNSSTQGELVTLLQLLLYGDKDFPDDVNKIILKLTIDFIHKAGRFASF